MTFLLDGNGLVALTIDTHEFHARMQRWFDALDGSLATCAVTEGTLLRLHMRFAEDRSATAAWTTLKRIHALPTHVFWTEGFSYLECSPDGLTGPAQITDAWLAELARRRGGRLVTMDTGLAATHADVALLIPI